MRSFLAFVTALALGATVPARADEAAKTPTSGWLDPLRYRDVGKAGAAALRKVEFVEMLTAVLKGADMGPNDGWFRHGSQSRYSWQWLARFHGIDPKQAIERKDFKGPPELFERLDRNHDGRLKADDFDWSLTSTYARAAMPSSFWFRMIDANSNGRISRAEWDAFFERISKGKGYLTPEDLREALPVMPPPRPPGPPPKDDGPTPLLLTLGLFSGELGSPFSGPRVGDPAPDFTLPTQDGSRWFSLAQFRGKKPLVLIFGSFT
jgi:hypothetical protein